MATFTSNGYLLDGFVVDDAYTTGSDSEYDPEHSEIGDYDNIAEPSTSTGRKLVAKLNRVKNSSIDDLSLEDDGYATGSDTEDDSDYDPEHPEICDYDNIAEPSTSTGRKLVAKLNRVKNSSIDDLSLEDDGYATGSDTEDECPVDADTSQPRFDPEFFSGYKRKVEPSLRKLYSKPRRSIDPVDCDILQTDNMAKAEKTALWSQQIKMKRGMTWEILMGYFPGFEILPAKHPSHCDVANKNSKLYIQLKNKYNTVNSDSATQNKFRLASFKRDNPDFTVVWGIINPRKKYKSAGFREDISYNGEVIEKWHGKYLLDRVFTHNGYNYFPDVLKFAKSLISEYDM
jgi:hypothetical protein